MVVIRLSRRGAKKDPRYRITVADKRRWLNGKFIEVIGHYNPVPRGQEKELVVDIEKAESWIKKGAQPSDRVSALLKKAGAKVTGEGRGHKTAAPKKAATETAAPAAT